jgi:hypothetical protein
MYLDFLKTSKKKKDAIEYAIREAMAAPFIPNIGINNRFKKTLRIAEKNVL